MIEPRAVAAWLGWTGLIWVGVSVAAQFMPLLNVAGYEYASLVTGLVSTVGLARMVYANPCSSGVWERWWSRVSDGLVFVAIALAISFANMVRVRNCDPLVGLAYLVVFPALQVPYVAAVVTFLERVSARPGRWASLLVGVATVANGLFLVFQPPIVAYSAFFGYYAGSIYDESLVGFGTHFVFRIWSSVAALTFLAGTDAIVTQRRVAKTGFALGVLALVGIWSFRGTLGLEKSRAFIADELGGLIETEHFDIYYDAQAYDSYRLALLVSDHEARYAELAEFWEHEPEQRMVSFVYGSTNRKGDLMGGYRTLVAKIWLGEMHITWDGVGDELLAHEMSHLFLRDDGTGPLMLSTRAGVIPLMALVEGSATASAWGANEMDYHAWSAALYELELGVDITELLGPTGFWSRYSRTAYTLTGSFVRWLVDTYGPERFRQAYGHGHFEEAYGQSLEELVGEWREFLDEYELDDDLLEAARFRYDRSSLFGRLCARSIATRFEDGEALLRRNQDEEAIRCFERILEDDPNNVSLRLQIAESYVAAALLDEAEVQARWIADAEGAGQLQKLRALELIADVAWSRGESESALELYSELLDAPLLAGDRRRLLVKRLALERSATAPRTADAVRRYLTRQPVESSLDEIMELVLAYRDEGEPLAAYLAGLRLSPEVGGSARELLAEALEGVPAELRARALEAMAYNATVSLEPAQACELWQQVFDESVFGSARQAAAGMWLGRCARDDMPASSE